MSIKDLLYRLVGNKNTVSINTLFIDYTGNHQKALILSQMFYWQGKAKITFKEEKGTWFCKDYEDWFEETRVKKQTARRAINDFQKKGILSVVFKKFSGVPKNHYQLDVDALVLDLMDFLKADKIDSEGINLIPSENPDSINLIPSTVSKSNPSWRVSKCHPPYTKTTYKDYNTENSPFSDAEKKVKKNKHLKGGKNVPPQVTAPPPKIETNPDKSIVLVSERQAAKEVNDYLNQVTGKNIKARAAVLDPIINRIKEGFQIDEFKLIIDVKWKEWKGCEMEKNMRTITLFGEKHFDNYLDWAKKIKKNPNLLKKTKSNGKEEARKSTGTFTGLKPGLIEMPRF